MVTYEYDSWGKLESLSGTLATTVGADNPFRYRGYYYDTETSLYYLNQRYYNPECGRFINADDYMGQTGLLLAHKLFAYCAKNPVMISDPSGMIQEEGYGGYVIYGSPISVDWSSVMKGLVGLSLVPSIIDSIETTTEMVKNKASEFEIVYRVYGGDADRYGYYWSPVDPK